MKKSTAIIIGIIILISIFTIVGYNVYKDFPSPQKKIPIAEQGVIDLTDWDFEKDGIIQLNGKWAFYWDKLLTYDDFQKDSIASDIFVDAPKMWNKLIVDGEKVPVEGYVTYRLVVKTNHKNQQLGLKIDPLSPAYRMYVNDMLVAENGVVSTGIKGFKSGYDPMTVIFKNEAGQFEIIIQMANFSYARGGFWCPIFLGLDHQIIEYDRKAFGLELFLIGSLLMMAVYFLSFYLLRRENRTWLYFGLACTVAVSRVAFTGQYLILDIFPTIHFDTLIRVEYLSTYGEGLTIILLFYYLYPIVTEKHKKFIYIFSGTILILCFIIVFTPVSVFTELLHVGLLLAIVAILYCLYVIVRAMSKKQEGAGYLLVGTSIMAITAIYDMLYSQTVIDNGNRYIFHLGLFTMVCVYAFVLSKIFSGVFDKATALSERLMSLNKMKDEFLANTSHELKGPLNGIVSLIQPILRKSEKNLETKDIENLELVVSSSRRLSNLVNDILDFSKLKHGDIKLNYKNVNISAVVSNVLNINKNLIVNKNIELINDVDKDICTVYFDEDRLIQILFNLVDNAIKFTDEGTIRIYAFQKDDMVEINVEDTGRGISQDKMNNIFKTFESLESSDSQWNRGVGLGLSITKYLIELQGGTIWVQSEVGKGTTFTLLLPQGGAVDIYEKNVESEEKCIYEINESLRESAAGKITSITEKEKSTILVVDDDYVNQRVITDILNSENYSVIVKANGLDGFNTIKKQKIDLAILDIVLPEMTGYELCEKIRDNYSLSELPVLFITSQGSQQALQTGFKAGGNDFLRKPFESSELKARIQTLLAFKKSAKNAINSEIAYLQAQIKPHFLFNTLNTIEAFCITDSDEARKLIGNLSNFLRSNFEFESSQSFVSIKYELELVRTYLEIEKARFGEKITFKFDVDESCIAVYIPRLIIQPLVENALKHGLLTKKEGGKIGIRVKAEKEDIKISVEDDGIGFNLEETPKKVRGKRKSIGLNNINHRLNKIYGRGIVMESKIGVGTKVIISIPKESAENC